MCMRACVRMLINGLISNVKKVLLKSPLRVQIYKEKLPDVPLPPEPVITRWGTWLNAAIFLANHYAGIKEVILGVDPGSSQAVRNCVGIFNDETIANQLAYIKVHFSCLVDAITKLESRELSLSDRLGITNNMGTAIDKANNNIVKTKFCTVLDNNKGYKKLVAINKVLMGSFDETVHIDPELISRYMYAPVTSCKVKRSFLYYKHFLNDRRLPVTMENIEKYLVTSYYHSG